MERKIQAWLRTLCADLANVEGVQQLDARLGSAAEALGLDGLSLWERRRTGQLRLCGHWHHQGLDGDSLCERAPWLSSTLADNETLLPFASLQQLPPEAGGDRKLLEICGIASLLLVPLRRGGNGVGQLFATCGAQLEAWTAERVQPLELVADLLSNTLGRIHAERAVRQEQARFTQLLRAAPDAVVVVRADGRIDYANDQAACLFGYESLELHGCSIETLLPSISKSAHGGYRQAYSAAPTGQVMGAERSLHAAHKDGYLIPVEINLSTVDTDEGPMVTAIVRDITERRRAEEKVREQRNELARVSRIATVGELAGALAHELNQPLAAILSNAQAAQRFLRREQPDIDQVRQIVTDIIEDDRRAAAVIHQMRRFLKHEELELGEIELNRLIRDTLRALHSDLAINQVCVATELCEDLPLVHGNLVQLQQVILNLVLNAVDAMQAVAHVDRIIRLCSGRADAGSVSISVRDTGHGVNRDVARRIFGPFFTTKKDGMGMGLPIARSIVEAHGGHIEVANNHDRGCTFRVLLPAAGSRT